MAKTNLGRVRGLSAYEFWLAQGNIGTEAEYLAAIKGDKGDKGDTGAKGDKGDKGDTGDVNTAQMDAAISAAVDPVASQLAANAPESALVGNLVDAENSSPLICVIGDSTGNETWEWVYKLAQKIAEKYPTHNIKYKLHSGIGGSYGAWESIQTVGEDRYLDLKYAAETWKGSGQYPIADITKTSPDIDITLHNALTDWQQTGNGYLLSQMGTAGHMCWAVRLLSGTSIRFYWYTDGTSASQVEFISNIDTTGFLDGSDKWIRFKLDVDDGAGHYVVKSFTSTDGNTWTEVRSVTGASTTSVYVDNTVDYAIGSTDTNTQPLVGKYYEVIIRDGIDGPALNVQPIDACSLPTDTDIGFGGTPTVYIYNASIPGAGVTGWNDTNAIQRALPPSRGAYVLINLGHNEGQKMNASYLAEMDGMLTKIRARSPGATVYLLTQNPKLAVGTLTKGKYAQSVRRRMLMGWAKQNGVEVIDTYRAFVENGVDLSTLVNATDGVHHTEAGATLAASYIESKLNL